MRNKYTQFGSVTVIILLPLLLFVSVLLFKKGLSFDSEMYFYLFLFVSLLICLLVFYKLTITVDNKCISFKLGVGIFGKTYPLSDIESCQSVKNKWIYGLGIHMIPKGWLYNVSGLEAIELRFKGSDKIVRIGTDKSDEIATLISKVTNKTNGGEDENSSSGQSYSKSKNTYIAIVVTVLVVIFFNLYQSRPLKIDLQANTFEIMGEYGFEINYTDIVSIDTINQMPCIEMRTNGFALGKVCKGNFQLSNIGSAKLFINYDVRPFVQMVLKNNQVVYFNLKDKPSTIDVFEKIQSETNL